MSTSSSTTLTTQEVAAGVLRKGLLLKQGARVRSWKERWFVLFRDRLAYYDPSDYDPIHPNPNVGGDLVGKDNTNGRSPAGSDAGASSSSSSSSSSSAPVKDKAKGVLALSDVTSVSSLRSRGAFQVSVAANASTGVAERDYLLVAPSDTERKHWMESIQRAMLAPSRAALVLRQTRELHRRGQLCSREGEVISAWLMSGRDEDVESAVEMMTVASQIPAADRGSDRLESLLVDFRIADTEAELMRVLQSLKTVLEEEDTNASIRDRLVELAMRQYSASTDKLAQALEAQRIGGGEEGASASSSSSSNPLSPPPSASLSSSSSSDSSSNAAGNRVSQSLISKAGSLFRMSTRLTSPTPAAATPATPQAAMTASERQLAALGEDPAAWGHGSRRRESPVLSLYGGMSPSHSTVTSGAVKWSATIQDMFSLVLHTIAMRCHAQETGDADALEGLVPQPGDGNDGDDDDAGSAAGDEGRDKFDDSGAPGTLRKDKESSAPAAAAAPDVSAITLSPDDPLAQLREDGIVTQDYRFAEKLGEGAYSVVYRATHNATGEQVAVKVAKKAALTPAELRRLVDEVGIMAGLDHVHVVRLHAFYEDAQAFYIVTELMTGGELFDRIVQRTVYGEREARDIVRTLAEALDYMHGNGIVHRDLKPENILLSSPEEGKALIKIADMGFAKRLHPSYYAYFDNRGVRRPESFTLSPPEDVQQKRAAQLQAMQQQAAEKQQAAASGGAAAAPAGAAPPSLGPWDPTELGLTTSCGTPSYVSPEILLGKHYGPSVDMWSLGVISYILLAGYAPFAASNQTDLFRAIVAGKFQFDSPYWDRVSNEAKDLIRKLLVTDPTRRATAREVLQHRWLQGTVSSVELSSALGQMRLFQASRKQIIRRGELRKVGRFVKNTKKRLFMLTSDSLEYYEPSNDGASSATSEPGAAEAGINNISSNRPKSFAISSSGGPPSLAGAAASGGPPSLALGLQSSPPSTRFSDDGNTSVTSSSTASAAAASEGSAPASQQPPMTRASSNRELGKDAADGSAAGGFPALLASLGFFGAAAATKQPKGSIPIKDIRGVAATDHFGKDLPPQRVVSVSLGKNGSSATITPAHFKESTNSSTAAASASSALPPSASNTFSPSFGALPGPSTGAGGIDEDDDESDKGTVYTAFTTATPPTLALGPSSASTGGGEGGVGSARAPSASSAAFNPASAFWFKVQTSSGRDYLLAADSEAIRGEWMRAITFTVQRWDLMRKAQVALAGERMAEAVALMRLAQDWSTLMELPGASTDGTKNVKGGAFGSSAFGTSSAKRANPLPSAPMPPSGLAGGATATGAASLAPKPGQLANTLSTVALRTHDPLEGDVGRSTRIQSKVTTHQAKLRARGSLLDLAAQNVAAFAALAATVAGPGAALPLPSSSLPTKGAGAIGGMATPASSAAAAPAIKGPGVAPQPPPAPAPPASPPPAGGFMLRRHGTCGEADEVGSASPTKS